MARSVVFESTPRCDRCRFVPRWCICAGFQAIATPFQVDVLIHNSEFWRPTSTGRLINRVVPTSRAHIFHRDLPLQRDAVVPADHPLWILHPRGEPIPSGPLQPNLHVMLLDGNWREASSMLRTVETWGTRVSLPMTGASRYWLRAQQGEGMYSTIEALLFLLSALGLTQAEAELRLQFELHVYAGLRTRGVKATAEKYLASSQLSAAFPALLEQLHQSRPRV